jgi:hypothetical protein
MQAFMQMCQASSTLYQPCMLLGVIYFSLWQVSLAEYLLVLRVYFSPIADYLFYHGCCKYCLLPAGDED